jgi:hypothetical protein
LGEISREKNLIVSKQAYQSENYLMHSVAPAASAEGLGIVVAELVSLLRSKIFLLVLMQVLLHLFHDMFCLVEVLNIQVSRRPGHFMGMTALRAEFPPLETIHVRKRAAGRAPDNKVHDKEVMRVIVI